MISERTRRDKDYLCRSVTTEIKGNDDSVLKYKADQIVIRLKQLYCLSRAMKDRDPNCTIDDISSKFKDLISGIYKDDIISEAIESAKSDFVWEREFVALPLSFIKYINTGDGNVNLRRRRSWKDKDNEDSQVHEVMDLIIFTRHLIAKSKREGKQTRAGNYRQLYGLPRISGGFCQEQADSFRGVKPKVHYRVR